MKKAVITGGCGFLGYHLCTHFRGKGYDVVAYDNLTKFEYERAGYNADKIRKHVTKKLTNWGVRIVEADILDYDQLLNNIEGAEFVIHAAAQPAMSIGLEDPKKDMAINVEGSLNVLEAARKAGCIPVASCSTIHVYGNGLNTELQESPTRFARYPWQIDEAEPILTGVLTPLHASKRALELYSKVYRNSYDMKTAEFRLSGLYGPEQFGGEDHGWVANFAIRAVKGLPVKIFGTDKQVRDILYIGDAVHAFSRWVSGGFPTGTFNLGGGMDTSVSLNECLGMLETFVEKEIHREWEPRRLGDLYWFITDYSKFEKETGWIPITMPSTGLRELVEWVKIHQHLFLNN